METKTQHASQAIDLGYSSAYGGEVSDPTKPVVGGQVLGLWS